MDIKDKKIEPGEFVYYLFDQPQSVMALKIGIFQHQPLNIFLLKILGKLEKRNLTK